MPGLHINTGRFQEVNSRHILSRFRVIKWMTGTYAHLVRICPTLPERFYSMKNTVSAWRNCGGEIPLLKVISFNLNETAIIISLFQPEVHYSRQIPTKCPFPSKQDHVHHIISPLKEPIWRTHIKVRNYVKGLIDWCCLLKTSCMVLCLKKLLSIPPNPRNYSLFALLFSLSIYI